MYFSSNRIHYSPIEWRFYLAINNKRKNWTEIKRIHNYSLPYELIDILRMQAYQDRVILWNIFCSYCSLWRKGRSMLIIMNWHRIGDILYSNSSHWVQAVQSTIHSIQQQLVDLFVYSLTQCSKILVFPFPRKQHLVLQENHDCV